MKGTTRKGEPEDTKDLLEVRRASSLRITIIAIRAASRGPRQPRQQGS
jgi:hypothetical protein